MLAICLVAQTQEFSTAYGALEVMRWSRSYRQDAATRILEGTPCELEANTMVLRDHTGCVRAPHKWVYWWKLGSISADHAAWSGFGSLLSGVSAIVKWQLLARLRPVAGNYQGPAKLS